MNLRIDILTVMNQKRSVRMLIEQALGEVRKEPLAAFIRMISQDREKTPLGFAGTIFRLDPGGDRAGPVINRNPERAFPIARTSSVCRNELHVRRDARTRRHS